jgi:hypothetical protein
MFSKTYYIDKKYMNRPPIPSIPLAFYSISSRERYISFPDVSAISEITVTNDVSLNTLVNGEYLNVTEDENTVLHNSNFGYIRITIFHDASAITYGLDSSGNPIISKLITNTVYTYPYIDASDVSIDGYMTTYFDDGTYFGNNDTNNEDYWYKIDGVDQLVPFVYSQLT